MYWVYIVWSTSTVRWSSFVFWVDKFTDTGFHFFLIFGNFVSSIVVRIQRATVLLIRSISLKNSWILLWYALFDSHSVVIISYTYFYIFRQFNNAEQIVGHVVPSEQLLPIGLARGSSGLELDFTYHNRDTAHMVSTSLFSINRATCNTTFLKNWSSFVMNTMQYLYRWPTWKWEQFSNGKWMKILDIKPRKLPYIFYVESFT